jgi:predicted O-linked N-acetylglucosamine transferase (SPINDLY family)
MVALPTPLYSPAPDARSENIMTIAPHALRELVAIPAVDDVTAAPPAATGSWSAQPAAAVDDNSDRMLASPPLFRRAGEAAAYGEFMSRQVAQLRDVVALAPDGETARRLAQKFAAAARFHPLYFNSANVREAFRARAQLLEAALVADGHEPDWAFPARTGGARLKLGVLAYNFAAGAETFATLPLYRELDRNRFDVTLFALRHKHSATERCCASHADDFVVLPAGLAAQVQALRAADLDLIYIGTNVTASAHDMTRLALHRLARVQVAGVCSCVTTGMRNVDCYLSGRLSEPADAQAHYTEKLYMIDGPAHCYDFGDAAPTSPARRLRRADYGIPRAAVVFASGANFYKILPELDEVWFRILAAVPESRLVLYPFNPQWDNEYAVAPFMARLAAGLKRHHVDPQRLLVFNTARGRDDVLQRVALADLYLDSFPFSGATSLLDPLLAGIPVVAMNGASFRSLVGPAILRSLGLGELIANDVNAYISLALRLAANRGCRRTLSRRITAAMHGKPVIFDAERHAAEVGRAFEQMWQDYAAGALNTR